MARPRAPCAVAASWAATAATPVKTSPHAPMASTSAAEPAAGSFSLTSHRKASRTMTTLAVAAVSSAAVSGACRPTAAEPTSSRAASSSARVCRTTTKIASTAAMHAAQTPNRQVVSAPVEVPSRRP